MKYKYHLNFLNMVLVVNNLKTAVTTYLGKKVTNGKETERLFILWYCRLFRIFSFCKYKEIPNCEFPSNCISRKCILLGVLKNHLLFFYLVYQLYCIFFPLMILKLLELSFCHISKTPIYTVDKLFIFCRWRILSDFTSRTCVHRCNVYLRRNSDDG